MVSAQDVLDMIDDYAHYPDTMLHAGDLNLNRELSVTICLTPGDGTMQTPVIKIHREIFSKPMFDVIAHKDQQVKHDAEWAEMMDIMMRQAREAGVTTK